MGDDWTGQVETIVVGAGVIGLAVAHELLLQGSEVWVLERDRPGCGATWAAGGMLAPISEAEQGEPELTRFGQDSLRRYPRFVESLERFTGLSCAYRTDGTLWVAVNRDDVAELEHLCETLQSRNLPVQTLNGTQVVQREPHLSGRIHAGLLVEQDHQVDPRALIFCLEQAVRARGGKILCGTQVREVTERNGRLHAVLGRNGGGDEIRLRCDDLVLATGAWSCRELVLPVPNLGVRPVKGQLLRLRGQRLLRHVVRTPDSYLIPREDGELLIGATMEEMGYDTSATAGAAMDLLRHAWEALPAIYDLQLHEISVGLRSAVEDNLPLIGPTGIEGLHLALAHHRNGILLAPATAHYLAQRIRGEREVEALKPFLPSRAAVAGRERDVG
jgi:glycine oxidase